MTTTTTIDKVHARLEAGEPASPEELDLIIADIRRQRKLYETGGRAKSVEDRQAEEISKFMKSLAPPKPELKRRPL